MNQRIMHIILNVKGGGGGGSNIKDCQIILNLREGSVNRNENTMLVFAEQVERNVPNCTPIMTSWKRCRKRNIQTLRLSILQRESTDLYFYSGWQKLSNFIHFKLCSCHSQKLIYFLWYNIYMYFFFTMSVAC